MPTRTDLVYKSTLKARGWTDTLIKRFLPEPDRLVRNPHYGRLSASLYRLDRVEAAEASADFRMAIKAAQKRQMSAVKAVEAKTAKLDAHISGLIVHVEHLDREELVRRGCEHFNARNESRGDWRGEGNDWVPASSASDQSFLDRICVNCARHQLTTYEGELFGLHGKPHRGIRGYERIKEAVLREIAVVYPWLDAECNKQILCIVPQ